MSGKRKSQSGKKISHHYPANEALSGSYLVREKTKTAPTKIKQKTSEVKPPTKKYLDLICRYPLRPIETEQQNRLAMTVFSELMKLSAANRLSPDEEAYFDVLSKLIGEFEDKTYDLGPPTTGADMLKWCMEQHGLRQADLIKELGSQTTVSLILNGKRKMTRGQIERVAKRFDVDRGFFFD